MKLDNTYTLFDPQTACLTEKAMFDYIDRKLTPAQDHAVEKHLLDCAFCSEAMEGLELISDRNKLRASAENMEARLSKGTNTHGGKDSGGRLISFNFNTRLAAAAVIVLLIGSFVMLRYILNGSSKNIMADKREAPLSSSSPLVTTSDDQTFQKHFEPFPPEENKTTSAEKSKTDNVGESMQQESTGFTNSPQSANANSFSGDAITTTSPPPAYENNVREKTIDVPASPPAKLSADKDKDMPGKQMALKKTVNPKPEAADGYYDRMDSTKISDKLSEVVANTQSSSGNGISDNETNNKASGESYAAKKEKKSAHTALAAKEAPASQPVFKSEEAKKKTAKTESKSDQNDSKLETPQDKKVAVSGNTNAVADSSSVAFNQTTVDSRKIVTGGAPDQGPTNSTPDKAKTKSNSTVTGMVNSGTANYNWTLSDETKAKGQTPASTYVISAGKPAERSGLSATGSKTAALGSTKDLDEGMAAYRNKDFALAIDQFRKVLANDASDETALFYSGVSYLGLPVPDAVNAILNLDAVLARPNSTFAEAARWYKALALIKDKRTSDARLLLNDIIKTEGPYKTKAEAVLKDLGEGNK